MKAKPTIADSVLDKIEHGSVRMKSKQYFAVLSIVSSLFIGLAVVALSYMYSIIFFWLRIQTSDTIARGARLRLDETLKNFPWWVAVAALVLLGALVWFIKKYGALQRYRAGIIVPVVVLVSLLFGLLASSFGVGELHSRKPSFGKQHGQNQSERGPAWRQNQRN